ncbi:2-hydroxychromene-2-carboxylate isomerase [Roseospirillum parvum]|uniref:2-hydroxychromene-2-carboxylate isomerase n=1 Tax=Roseospirillum parvum TaxID=83401 RepID=A0A1G7WK18_9PROT|nr:2-hydroxychromene-2-carboxylate isomerase [Roseospirillum parvum]SDG72357.1 2-hydroxychromene-2-carboxylate isomerase [Roseospirillum parvum]
MVAPILFYFDFSSPYGYLAAQRVDAMAEVHDRTVDWRPILLGPAMSESGNRPLLDQPMKGDYARRDMERMARLWGVPFTLPEPFPVATLAAARGFYWLSQTDRGRAVPFAKAVYLAYFAEGRDISRTEVVVEVAAGLGIAPDAFLAAVQEPTIKARLKAEVARAMELGVFGSPFLIVDGEPFWGADRLEQASRWLATSGW